MNQWTHMRIFWQVYYNSIELFLGDSKTCLKKFVIHINYITCLDINIIYLVLEVDILLVMRQMGKYEEYQPKKWYYSNNTHNIQ